MRLKDKVALITGAGTGIGRASAVLMAKEGAKVVVATRTPEHGEETVKKIKDFGGEAIFVKTDVSKSSDVKNAIKTTVETYGKLNVLFNNAGIWIRTCEVKDMTEEEWDAQINVNLKGVFLTSKYAIPEMIKAGGGSIINTASTYGHVGAAGAGAYCASKGGIVLLTKVLAIECAKYNIRVNCVCPGAIVTPLHAKSLGGTPEQEKELGKKDVFPKFGELFVGTEEEKEHLKRHPIGRFGSPYDVAHAVVFLASDESSFITGSSIFVDGGYTAW